MDDLALLDLAVRLVADAAAKILVVRAAGFTVAAKSDASPVTVADMEAEAIITEGLRAAAPAIPVIAEEEVAAGRVTALAPEYWLVDPLDGTREFAAGREEFAVNVGLVRNGVAILGAVASPALHEIHYGLLGHGAFKRARGKTTKISARHAPQEGLTVMASRHYAADPALAALLAGHRVASLTNIGSALKIPSFWQKGGRIFIPVSAARWNGTPPPPRLCWKPPAAQSSRRTDKNCATASRVSRTRISTPGACAKFNLLVMPLR